MIHDEDMAIHLRSAVWAAMLVFLLTAFGTRAWAGDEPTTDLMFMDIEELRQIKIETVTSASKFPQKVTEAPSSVTIITADQIRKYGYRTLADILKSVKGIFVSNDKNYSYLGIRGFGRTGDYNNRFLLLVDGYRMNDNIVDQANIGHDFILDADLISRVEVVPGPSSSLYGGNAFLGIINVITKGGADFKGVQVSGAAGSFDTYAGRASYGKKYADGVDTVLSASAYDSKGQHNLYYPEFDYPYLNNGVAVDGDYENNVSVFEKTSYQDFTLEGGYISREKGIPNSSWVRVFNETSNRTLDIRGFVGLKYAHTFDGDIGVQARAYYNYYSFKGDYVYDSANPGYPPYDPLNDPALYMNKDYFEGQWWGSELMVTKKLMERHTLTIGAEYRNDFKQNQMNYDPGADLVYLDDRRNSDSWGVYAQDEYAVLKNLLINLGVRYDHYNILSGETADSTNPRAAVIYSPVEKTTFKLLYGTAFRAPNAWEKYYNYPACGLTSNPGVKPEKIQTYEAVYEQYFGDHYRFTAAGFTYKVKDRIILLPDPNDPSLFSSQNQETVKAEGLELELDGKWAGGLEGTVNYTIQQAKSDTTGERIPNSPRQLAKLKMIIPIFDDKLFAGMEEQYMGSRKTYAGNEVSEFFITNITLFSREIVKRAELSASVYNLFDKKYSDPASKEHFMDTIEQDGRTWNAKVTYTF